MNTSKVIRQITPSNFTPLVIVLILTLTALTFISYNLEYAIAGPAGGVVKGQVREKDKDSVHLLLGPESGTMEWKLYGWYCSIGDMQVNVSDEMSSILSMMPDYSLYDYQTDDADEEQKAILKAEIVWLSRVKQDIEERPLENSFMLVSFENEPTVYGLDAPKGKTVTYTKQYCYTAAELSALKSSLLSAIQNEIDGKKAIMPSTGFEHE